MEKGSLEEMTVQCGRCLASYALDPSVVRWGGLFQCTRCEHTFPIEPPPSLPVTTEPAPVEPAPVEPALAAASVAPAAIHRELLHETQDAHETQETLEPSGTSNELASETAGSAMETQPMSSEPLFSQALETLPWSASVAPAAEASALEAHEPSLGADDVAEPSAGRDAPLFDASEVAAPSVEDVVYPIEPTVPTLARQLSARLEAAGGPPPEPTPLFAQVLEEHRKGTTRARRVSLVVTLLMVGWAAGFFGLRYFLVP